MVSTRELAELLDHVERVSGQGRAGRRRSAVAVDRGGRSVPRADPAWARGRARRERAAGQRVGARGARSPSRRPRGGGARALRATTGAGRRADGATRFASGSCASGSSARDGGDSVMIAQRRADVADLNARARERLQAAGTIGADGARAAGRRVRRRRPGRGEAQRPADRRDERAAWGGGRRGSRSRRAGGRVSAVGGSSSTARSCRA